MIIDNDFQNLIPALSVEEYEQLRESIKEDGIRDALVVWNDILIDGHNRYKISQELGIQFKTTEKSFDSRSYVIEWIIKNQFGRRNISKYDSAILALKLKDEYAARAKEQQIRKPESVYSNSKKQKPMNTHKELSETAGVSVETIWRVDKINKEADDKAKEKIRSGETTINAVWTKLMGRPRSPKKKKLFYLTESRHNAIKELVDEIIRIMTVDTCVQVPIKHVLFELGNLKEQVKKLTIK